MLYIKGERGALRSALQKNTAFFDVRRQGAVVRRIWGHLFQQSWLPVHIIKLERPSQHFRRDAIALIVMGD